jgi:DNA-binding PadR family transcriptional regulator
MKGTYLGEFEELVLLTVGVLYKKAYGVAIMEEGEKQTKRSINISAVHTALKRLDEKGYVKSMMGEPTQERGGRTKRLFSLTAAGKKALEEAHSLRTQMFNQIPRVALEFKLI